VAHAFLTALGNVEVIQRCRKVPFPSRQEALKAARVELRKNTDVQCGNGTLSAYRCKICGGQWHLGTKGIDQRGENDEIASCKRANRYMVED